MLRRDVFTIRAISSGEHHLWEELVDVYKEDLLKLKSFLSTF
ncbi:MAG: hypothetical protein ACLVKR_04200 [Lachnospiraceae bacterium]